MRIRISSRKSDLARLQSYRVAEALQAVDPSIQVEFQFRESLGDKNLTDPLWKIPEKGVFTEDFYKDLCEDQTDIVVHSWKDLPTESKSNTSIIATLPRADQRDVLLFRKDRLQKHISSSIADLNIFSSSPRRAYNLSEFLPQVMPFKVGKINFEPVRGNIQTRVKKLLESSTIDGLVLAKAALDRMLSSKEADLQESKNFLLESIKQCQWMVLPISANPNAPAQGAIAIEALSSRADLKTLFSKINDQKTYDAVLEERKVLAAYGGGCHQKIGVAVLPRPFGQLKILRGLSDSGEVLRGKEFIEKNIQNVIKTDEVFDSSSLNECFQRVSLQVELPSEVNALFIAKVENSEQILKLVPQKKVIWTSGISSWSKLAKNGVWVNGCQDNLGEAEPMNIEALCLFKKLNWAKLTHESAFKREMETFPLYRLEQTKKIPDLRKFSQFYWTSGYYFLKAITEYPELLDEKFLSAHSCGPGNTFDCIQDLIREKLPLHLQKKFELKIYLDSEQWRNHVKHNI